MARTLVVLVKYVPDAASTRTFADDNTTVRTGDGVLSELDEYAVEEALKLAESGDWEVAAVTMGPAEAETAIKKALQMGADRGYHVLDDSLHGSDAVATSSVLAAAVDKLRAEGDVGLVMCGMASTDGGMSVVPAMLAERLDLPQVTFAAEVTVDGDTVRIRRDGDTATEVIEASLPALVSVTDQINEPRYPSFKGIMAAKKKPVETWSLADLGVDASTVGLSSAWSLVEDITARPPRGKGTIVTDDGTGAAQLVDFLVREKLA
ncbi:MAG: electron transfer flavoprotein subunit beta/FixA family protein [Actinomycetales bacterium]